MEQRGHGRSEARDFDSWVDFSRDLRGALGIATAWARMRWCRSSVTAATCLMDKTRMLPMEDPALVARLIVEAMREVSG